MTTKERLHRIVDELTDSEAEEALRALAERRQAEEGGGEEAGEMAALPEGWGETLTGEPMPDVVGAVRRSRKSH